MAFRLHLRQAEEKTCSWAYPIVTLKAARDDAQKARDYIADEIDPGELRRNKKKAEQLSKLNDDRANDDLPVLDNFEHITRKGWPQSRTLSVTANHLAKSAISESLAKTKMIVCATKLSLFSSLPDKKTH